MSDSLARDGQDGSDDSDVDVEHVKELVGFVTSAPKRHPRLAIAIFVLTVIAAITGSLTVPKWWAAEVSILVHKKLVLTDVATQNQQNDRNDDPMRGAYEEVMQHDNLVALVREGHLIERSQKKRGTIGRFKDRVLASFRPAGPINTGEIEEALASLLAKKMSVGVEGSTLNITVEWYDAETAFELVKIAQKKFMDGRYQQEVSGIADGIALLDEHAKAQRQAVDDALEQFQQTKDPSRSASTTTTASASTSTPGTAPAPSPRPSVGHIRGAPDPDLARAVEDKRRQIRELEDDRQRRLAELKNQLAGLMATYTSAHPAVVALQSKIDALQEEPAQLAQLKNEERALLLQIAAATEKATEGSGSTGGSISRSSVGSITSRPSDSPNINAESLSLRDPVAGLALRNLQNAIRKYEEISDEISKHKLRLDVAKAAFQQRYAIFKPAEMPQAPRKGNPTLLILIGVVMAFLLSMVGPVIADVASGRFIEAWQVKRRLGLPLLGEVTRP